jgi:hypothetical protein
MDAFTERRIEERLNCNWRIWFSKGYGHELYVGRILNISSKAMVFACEGITEKFETREELTTYISVPRTGVDDNWDVVFLRRKAVIRRAEDLSDSRRLIVAIFETPLTFKPAKLVERSGLIEICRQDEL